MTNWLILLPPTGAARQASSNLLNAFKQKVPASSIHVFDCSKYLTAFNTMLKNPDETMAIDLLNQSLVIQCLQYEITHLFVPALSPVTLFTLNLVRKQHIKTIHWFIEDYQRATYWREVVSGYSIFIAVQKGPLPKICKDNNCQFIYLPTAASQESINQYQQQKCLDKKADLAFVGLPSYYRVQLLEHLASQGISLTIAGEGWNEYKGPLSKYIISGTWVDSQQSASITNSALIALNASFKEPSGNLSDIQLSPRVYDILSSGTILLTEDVPLIYETLGDCHFYTYKNIEEIVNKVNTIKEEFNNDNLVKHIQENRQIILQNHTWQSRVEQIINLCVNK